MASNQPATTSIAPSWLDLKVLSESTKVGRAMVSEVKLRSLGQGSAHVQNTLRTFRDKESMPAITLYRDHAGWCPYCQKTV
jgi:glutathione S-transferase